MGVLMKSRTLLGAGIGGFAATALCCVTPALVIVLTALGFAVWVGWLDYVLLPAMVGFLAVIAYGLWRRRCERCNTTP